MDYPIVGIIGRRGSGKTTYLAKLASIYSSANVNIFSNFSLTIPHYEIDFAEIASFPPYLHDCVLLIDEAHIGTDAYNFWSKLVKDITDFITQTRKLRITIYYTTQNIGLVAKRLRDQTDFIFQCEPLLINGVRKLDYFKVDKFDKFTDEYLSTEVYNGKPYYPLFDTEEIIMKSHEDTKPEDYDKQKQINLKKYAKST
ncbi:MAG: ABC transporter ATP-binding protein [Vulcanibacillus sp.]